MQQIKIKNKDKKQLYCIDTIIPVISEIAVDDVTKIIQITAANLGCENSVNKITIETQCGEYEFTDIKNIDFSTYYNEKIQKICVYIYRSEKSDNGSLYFNLLLKKDFYPAIVIESKNEIFTRGLYTQILSILIKKQGWYSNILKFVPKIIIFLLSISILFFSFTEGLHSFGVKYRYIILTITILLSLAVILQLLKESCPKCIFSQNKKNKKITYYFNNSKYFQHIANTITTIIITTIVNYMIFKYFK